MKRIPPYLIKCVLYLLLVGAMTAGILWWAVTVLRWLGVL